MIKLRNKKTGEIIEWEKPISYKLGKEYESLADLNAEWEDAPEEPKKTWFIDTYGSVRDREAMTMVVGWDDKPIFEFGTEEEAKKAVEKLKAWKRLKDKGIFVYLDHLDFRLQEGSLNFEFPNNNLTDKEMIEVNKDLDICFRR